jgi:hypothetical protein
VCDYRKIITAREIQQQKNQVATKDLIFTVAVSFRSQTASI